MEIAMKMEALQEQNWLGWQVNTCVKPEKEDVKDKPL